MASLSGFDTFRTTPESQKSRAPSNVTKINGDEDEIENEGEYSYYIDDDADVASSDSDGDIELIRGFNEELARNQLLNFIDCSRIALSQERQRELGLEIGVNVTAEHPWKQIKKDVISDYLIDDNNDVEVKQFRKKLNLMVDSEMVLCGYAPTLSEDEDIFLFFENDATARIAADLIEKLEAIDRLKAKHTLIKYAKPYQSMGSEHEVNLYIKKERTNIVDLEVQTIYPLRRPHLPFTQRLSKDVRDGYVALLPGKEKFDNLTRKRVDAYVQSTSPRIHSEQQTDPTFPANAWSQYLYEIVKDDSPDIDDEKQERIRMKSGAPSPVEVIEPSNNIKDLLQTLEFNQIDMYRNDYPYISKQKFPKYVSPYLQEKFCFANIAKSLDRYVCSIDWHPKYSGLLVCSYTFSTVSTSSLTTSDKIDEVKRTILSPNPVLMWCFDDTLYTKLELETPREITYLSICPYDENLIIAGAMNGQLLIWDITGGLENVETEEILTESQIKYRTIMRAFLQWTKHHNQEKFIQPAAISALQHSQKGQITNIQWMDRKHYITVTGNIRDDNPDDNNFRYFITSSMDGTIAFWDLDAQQILTEIKRQEKLTTRKLPEHMQKKVSEYDKLNRILRPVYILVYNFPITSIIFDCGTFLYEPIIVDANQKRKLFTRIEHKLIEMPREEVRNRMILTSFFGKIASITWDGKQSNPSDDIIKETITEPEIFASVHDGPITSSDRNTFLTEYFITIGRNIFVIWKDNLLWLPILWHRRESKLTHCKWSKDRPSVFFLARSDGNFETWDLLARTDQPALIDSLGGNVLTCISQHKLSLPQEAVTIGDYNSSLRLFLLPDVFTKPIENEIKQLSNFFDREIYRKTYLKKWQDDYYESNTEIREAKKKASEEAEAELKRLEKESKDREDMRLRKEADDERRAIERQKNKLIYDLPERLEKRWNEMNIKRLMNVLMSMKQIDPELLAIWTKPEKERKAYDERKRKAIADSFKRIDEDVAKLRAKLLPIEEKIEDRMDFIMENCKSIITNEFIDYDDVQRNALNYIEMNRVKTKISYLEFFERGRHRREIINKTLGANTQHRHTYDRIKKQRIIDGYANDDSLSDVGVMNSPLLTVTTADSANTSKCTSMQDLEMDINRIIE